MRKGDLVRGRYKVVSLLGQGGMGVVYLVEDVTCAPQHWALKELSSSGTDLERFENEQLFTREAELLGRLHHPALPAVIESFAERGHRYLLMEHVVGKTLADLMKETAGYIPEDDLRAWGMQVCDTLSYLHQQDPPVIYRDIKPQNLILTSDGTLKLIDFGIARIFSSTKKTDTNVVGTPGFASPEQYGRTQTDARSDVFSLGATLYSLGTKLDPAEIPFFFRVPSKVNPSLSRSFDKVVLRALSLNARERFQTARDFKMALEMGDQVLWGWPDAPKEAPPAPPEPSGLMERLRQALLRFIRS